MGLVLKAMKPELRRRGLRITQDDVNMQDLAANIVEEFNRKVTPTKDGHPVRCYMRTGSLISFKSGIEASRGEFLLHPGESGLLEAMVPGKYEKFNSNSGWSCGNACLPDALSHWSWVHSGGKHLLCDLQGQRGNPTAAAAGDKMANQTDKYWYLFTDPAICSTCRKFGITDLGEEGIEAW